MDPVTLGQHGQLIRLPRTRGDGPLYIQRSRLDRRASPHTRGWTVDHQPPPALRRGFPAHAGMDPYVSCVGHAIKWLPRTRGDGPRSDKRLPTLMPASPHTRGWTSDRSSGLKLRCGFPAHAGMDPTEAAAEAARVGLPRTRGDGPGSSARRAGPPSASPHTRGWTPLESF